MTNNSQAFIALVASGLWEQEVQLSPYGKVDFSEVFRLAQEQSVLGLVTAGLNHVTDMKVPYEARLMFVGSMVEVEQRNKVMNQFVAELVGRLRIESIEAILIKGQGVAQCYEKPLWRTAGDIDFLLDTDNYEKAKAFLCPLADKVEIENKKNKHLGLEFRGITVEQHGRMPFEPSQRSERVIDEVIETSFRGKNFRVWQIGNTAVPLLDPDNDVIIVFTHFLEHFFVEGVGLKQICDWCRLLWTFREEIDRQLLESRLLAMGLMTEWKAFASLAVDSLGIPEEAMPFYDKRYQRKGNIVLARVLKTGNLGHNSNQKYRSNLSKPLANTVTFFRRMGDFTKFAFIFPVDAPKFFANYVFGKFKRN